MRSTLVRRALKMAVLGGVVAGSMLATTIPAHANVPAGTKAVAAGGSDTTENFMKDYLAGKTSSNDGTTTYTVQTYNIPAFPGAGGYDVDDDGNCTTVAGNEANFPGGLVNWKSAPGTPTAPSGSGAGRTRLALEKTNNRACIDIGRSSSKGAEANFEYYGFAIDAVGWASSSLKAPSILTRAQVRDIYFCNVTDWGAVGGVPGPIQRYLPQNGSGTLAVFLSEFLDGSVPSVTGPNCPAVKQIDKNGAPMEENQGNTIADADIDKAILPYSAGLWVFQKNNSVNPSLDKRNNVRLGSLTTVNGPVKQNAARWNGTNGAYELDYVNASNPNGVVTDQNLSYINSGFSNVNDYTGIRMLFNVVDKTNALSYGPAVGLVGFDNFGTPSFKSPVCNNNARTLILSYGFAPLTTSGGGSTNLAGSTCRKFG